MKKHNLPKAGIAECCDITLEAVKIHWKKFLPLFVILVVLQAGANFLSDPMRLIQNLAENVPESAVLRSLGGTFLGLQLTAAASAFSAAAGGAVGAFLAFYLTTGGTLSFGRMLKRGFLYLVSGLLLVYIGFAIAATGMSLLMVVCGLISGSATFTLGMGLLAGVPFLLYLFLRVSLSGAMMLAHNCHIFKGLKQSWNYTKNRKARTLLALCAGALLAGEVGSILAAAAVLNLLGSGVAYRILAAVLSALSAVSGILPTAFFTVYVLREDAAAGVSAEEEQLNAFLAERGV